ncbi:hypothetical protein BDF21DRAFT_419083, partial [Thamnidium elegans]|uniref:F-box domain-containing protein n=1 Tax=Thamnidium elegans TaxID=101142 RepID=A0A8H7SWH3_9FUNG
MNLPQEVLLLIFQSSIQDQPILSAPDIFQCELVCKRWKLTAQRTNYTCLTLQSHHHIPKLIQTLRQSTTLAKFVRKLLINVPSYQHYLIHLLDILPFIDTVQVVEPNIDFYSNLITIHDRNGCKHLKNIQIPTELNDSQLLQVYATCVENYRHKLQTLLLYENDITLLNKLHQFPKLRQLVVKQRTNNIRSLDYILDQLPNLTKLDVALYNTIPFSTDNLIDSDNISPNSTLKLLDGLFVVQDSTLLYIIYKFSQLQELFINHDRPDEEIETVFMTTDITLSTLSQFMNYILSIPTCAISFLLDIPLITEALDIYTRHMPTKRLGPLSITYTRDSERQSTRWTVYRTSTKMQSHQFYIDYHCLTNGLLHLKLIETIGNYLSEITYRTNIDSIRNVHGYFLDHILQHCCNLTKLRLSCTKLIRCLGKPPLSSGHQSLTHLVLLNCYLGKDVFKRLSDRLKDLKKLVIVRCRLGSSGLDTRYYHIDMYDTTIDTVRLKSGHSITYITVRVTQSTKEEAFYKLWFDVSTQDYKTEPSTQQEYEIMPKADQHLQVWVQCKHVHKIQLFTNAKGNQVVFGQVTV